MEAELHPEPGVTDAMQQMQTLRRVCERAAQAKWEVHSCEGNVL